MHFDLLTYLFVIHLLCFFSTNAVSKSTKPKRINYDNIHFNISHPTKAISIPIEFRVAVITAGALRSFAFVAKSWITNIFLNNRSAYKIDLFAHVINQNDCPMYTHSLNILKSLSTDIEIFPNGQCLSNISYLNENVPQYYQYRQRMYGTMSTPSKGNFIDMHARRSRAYELSKKYAKLKNIKYDLVLFIRPDAAFYHSHFDYYQLYKLLRQDSSTNRRNSRNLLYFNVVTRNQKTKNQKQNKQNYNMESLDRHHQQQQQQPPTRMNRIIIPDACNFGSGGNIAGICDRFAIGLPATMDIYFQPNFPIKVLQWTIRPNSTYESEVATIDGFVRYNIRNNRSPSEYMLYAWFIMNDLIQVSLIPNPFAFITVRAYVM